MKVNYDNEVDALYIQISDEEPEGVIEVKEALNIDITKDGKIVGIELLDASRKNFLKIFFSLMKFLPMLLAKQIKLLKMGIW